jgi:hypothetical protein
MDAVTGLKVKSNRSSQIGKCSVWSGHCSSLGKTDDHYRRAFRRDAGDAWSLQIKRRLPTRQRYACRCLRKRRRIP